MSLPRAYRRVLSSDYDRGVSHGIKIGVLLTMLGMAVLEMFVSVGGAP